MSTKRFRLTKAAKILIFLIVLSCIGVGVFFGVKTGIIKSGNDKKICSDSNITSDTDGNVINTDKKDDKTAVNDGSDTTAEASTNIDEILKRKIRKGENIEQPPTA